MKPNPYAWDSHFPTRRLPRSARVGEILEYVRRGKAIKVVGGRGMGKSVTLRLLLDGLQSQPGTRAVLVDGPPEDATVSGAVRSLAARLGVRDLEPPRMDDLLAEVLQGDVARIVVLIDETDQYVADPAFARRWFNHLEAIRKSYHPRFDVVFAGGLGLLYLENEIGSGIVSRAVKCILQPFSAGEIAELAKPFQEDGRPLDQACLETIEVLSGGSPALVTYGLEQLWEAKAPLVSLLERIYGQFRERQDGFLRAVRDSVSRRGAMEAPWRALEVVRKDAGAVPLKHLRDACAAEASGTMIDYIQALDLLCAAGLVRVEGSALADPLCARPIASILNMPEISASTGDPIERLVLDVASVLASLRRFGRDFHDKTGLLEEDVFSSLIAVGLQLLGWGAPDREAIQAAGYTDLKVPLFSRSGLGEHVLIETKLWKQKSHNERIQQQVNDYRIDSTLHGIAVTLGERGVDGWKESYEETCLGRLTFEPLETPPDLVGRWRVHQQGPEGRAWITDHLLVQIPKRR